MFKSLIIVRVSSVTFPLNTYNCIILFKMGLIIVRVSSLTFPVNITVLFYFKSIRTIIIIICNFSLEFLASFLLKTEAIGVWPEFDKN